VWNAAQLAAQVAAKAWAAAQWLINAALSANPIGIVVVAIGALIAAFVLAYKTSDTFREIVDAAFDAVVNAAKAVFNWIKSNWPLLLAIITGPIGVAALTVIRHWDQIRDAVQSAVNAVKNAVTSAWNAIKSATSSAWGAVAGAVSDAVSGIKSGLNSLASWIGGFASGVLATVIGRVKAVFERIEDGARDALAGVKSAMNSIVSAIESIIGKISNAASSVANAIKRPINAVLSAWNGISLTIPTISIPSIKIGKKKIGGGKIGGQTISFPNVPLLAAGGVITAPTLAMVGEGQGTEIVTPEKLLRQIVGEQAVQVRVFIGDQELTQLVRTEIVDANTGLARSLLAGSA
jgi:phage-related protein